MKKEIDMPKDLMICKDKRKCKFKGDYTCKILEGTPYPDGECPFYKPKGNEQESVKEKMR